ncbi:hypothetical protein ACFLX2_00225 [Candidatus Dependentiae bacterium]
MKKRMIGLLVLSACSVVLAYRYGFARRSGVPTVCRGQYDCETEWSAIQAEHARCKRACPKKGDWAEYCEKNRENCKRDCSYLALEGASEEEIKKCEAECDKGHSKCTAAYSDDLAECEGNCSRSYQNEMDEFDQNWR